MITNAILDFFYNFIWMITSPLRGLPDAVLPSGVTAATDMMSDYLGLAFQVIPTTTTVMLSTLILILGYEVAYFSYKGIMWTIKIIKK